VDEAVVDAGLLGELASGYPAGADVDQQPLGSLEQGVLGRGPRIRFG
jgi:hypothetical protein